MLLILSTFFLATSVLSAEEGCQVGKVAFSGFDIHKYLGTWYELYRTENTDEDDYSSCEYDHYYAGKDGVGIDSVAYNTKTRQFETSFGTVPTSTGNTFDIRYVNDPTWSDHYYVIETDYQTYSVVRGCLNNDNEHPLTWIASKSTSFDDATKEKVNNILAQYNQSLDDFQEVDQSDCVKYQGL